MTRAIRIGIVAGESSGDILGAGLMSAILEKYPDTVFEGIGGPRMVALGLQSQAPMERLSVMGLVEPLKRLPELLGIRKRLLRYFSQNRPDVFIGIDSPDFNLGLEKKLKHRGIKTVHYVSPSVWAWRRRRVRLIEKATDLMLTLFPFEADFYRQHQIQVRFTGHPLADQIPMQVDRLEARRQLGLNAQSPLLALLPGSRSGEVGKLAPDFLACARLCLSEWPDLQIVIPCASQERRLQLEALLDNEFKGLPVSLIDGQAQNVMAAADCILIASGTATLEALLLKRPMLVCYRMAPLSFAIISRLLKVPYFSLPNLLAGRRLVEELVQDQVNAQAMFLKIKILMQDASVQEALDRDYQEIHASLRCDASHTAAEAVLGLIQDGD